LGIDAGELLGIDRGELRAGFLPLEQVEVVGRGQAVHRIDQAALGRHHRANIAELGEPGDLAGLGSTDQIGFPAYPRL
jgi:hypothetical protein